MVNNESVVMGWFSFYLPHDRVADDGLAI